MRCAAQHKGMPFGAVSSVVAWHRFGAFLSLVFSSLCRAPIALYVDDFFGASPQRLKWSGGKMLEVVTTLCGVLVDPDKSEIEVVSMFVLEMSMGWCLTFMMVQVRLDRLKARQWRESFEKASLMNESQPDQAQRWQDACNGVLRHPRPVPEDLA